MRMLRLLGRRGSLSEIERNGDELTVEWKIPNFFTLSAKGGFYYFSPGFNFGDTRWCLDINSNGDLWNKPAGCVLTRMDEGPPMTVRYTLSIIGEKEIESRGQYEYTFSKDDESYGAFDFFLRRVLKEHQSILIPDGVLTVRCIMKNVVSSPVKNVSSYEDTAKQTDGVIEESRACTCGSKSLNKQADASIQTDGDSREAEALSHSSAKQGCEKLHEDFSNLLASGEDSDVTVQVGDVEFKAHRAILSARCPVLSAMFRHDTEERATNRISVCDCEPEVFKQYLHFIYTGTVEPLSEKTVFGLYRIADKYLADDLKQNCLEHMKDSLSVQTFCDVLKLALTHGESDLLQLTIEFATKNLPLIICTVEWQNFLRDHPTEANEVLIKCICPQTKK